MQSGPTARLDCLLVVSDEALFARIDEVLKAWHLHYERTSELGALPKVEHGDCRVVVV